MNACLLLWVSLLAQDTPVFHAGVSLVRIDAEVSDGTRTLDGLRKEDFRVQDNGSPQTIMHFSQDEEPLDIVLLFDISGSMKPNVERVAAAAGVALGELRGGDRVAVWMFNRRSRVLAPFTEDLKAVERTLQVDLLNIRFGGGTQIQTAVDDVAEFFLRQPKTQRRRAVLVFTDDIGAKTRKEKTVVEHYWEADALLSELIIRSTFSQVMRSIPTPGNILFNTILSGTITHIVEKTGGETLKANDAGTDFQQMMQRIRRRYSLYYTMPAGKPGQHREVKVDLSEEAKKRLPGARVRARKGYILPGS